MFWFKDAWNAEIMRILSFDDNFYGKYTNRYIEALKILKKPQN